MGGVRYQTLLLTIVLNISAILIFSILYEYIDVAQRFQSIENNMNVAVASALEASTASEELFSKQVNTTMYSEGVNRGAGVYSNSNIKTGTLFYDRQSHKMTNVDVYKLSVYYGINNRLPLTTSNLTSGIYNTPDIDNGSGFNTAAVFRYLYGSVDSDYANTQFIWANRNTNTKAAYTNTSSGNPIHQQLDGNGRRANDASWNAFQANTGAALSTWALQANNFSGYYEKVGHLAYSFSYLKEKSGPKTFKVARESDQHFTVFPVLAQMGLIFNTSVEYNYNNLASTYLLDNFCSSLKIGKRKREGGMGDYSYYFLTPYSLGVTYIPMSIYKPVFTSVLDANIRLSKIATGDEVVNVTTLQESDGCLDTNVYSSASGIADEHQTNDCNYVSSTISNKSQAGTDAYNGKEFIVNDGLVEYDMNSISCKVDYFTFDIYSDQGRNEVLVANVIGGKTGISEAATVLEYSTYAKNPVYNPYYQVMATCDKGNVAGQRIIAKITTKIKVHVPYKSSILQWVCKRSGTPGHYGVKLWDEFNQKVSYDNDDIWYQCETYYSNVR